MILSRAAEATKAERVSPRTLAASSMAANKAASKRQLRSNRPPAIEQQWNHHRGFARRYIKLTIVDDLTERARNGYDVAFANFIFSPCTGSGGGVSDRGFDCRTTAMATG